MSLRAILWDRQMRHRPVLCFGEYTASTLWGWSEMDSVNLRSDNSRDRILVKLESLILAQNERWRQA